MNSTEQLLEPVADFAALQVPETVYSVSQLLVGGVVIAGAAAGIVYGIRKMFNGALGKN